MKLFATKLRCPVTYSKMQYAGRILARYENLHRVMDIQEFILNKSYDGIIGWYDYYDRATDDPSIQ